MARYFVKRKLKLHYRVFLSIEKYNMKYWKSYCITKICLYIFAFIHPWLWKERCSRTTRDFKKWTLRSGVYVTKPSGLSRKNSAETDKHECMHFHLVYPFSRLILCHDAKYSFRCHILSRFHLWISLLHYAFIWHVICDIYISPSSSTDENQEGEWDMTMTYV